MKKSSMRLIAFFALLIFLGSTSCKKNPVDISIGTVSTTINGTAITFNVQAKATVLAVGGGFGIKVFGYKKDPSSSATSLTLTVVDQLQ